VRPNFMLALCLSPSLALAQPAPLNPQTAPTASASTCKGICEKGEANRLSAQDDKILYFSCFIGGFCGNCKEATDSKRICNPIAKQPPAGSPWDIIQRSIDGRG